MEMAGRKPIEKRLMNIENGIVEIKEKLCEIKPCTSEEDEDVATAEPSEEE